MKEECKNRMEVLLLDEADRLQKLQVGSEEYSKTSRLITDLFRELNSMDKNEYESENEFAKVQNDYKIKREELDQKRLELELETKKSKKEFIGRVFTAGLSVGIPLIIAVIEPKGFFVKLTNWKTQKF